VSADDQATKDHTIISPEAQVIAGPKRAYSQAFYDHLRAFQKFDAQRSSVVVGHMLDAYAGGYPYMFNAVC
jgi:hypothetical protein